MRDPPHITPLWSRAALVLACAGAIVAAVLLIGPSSSSSRSVQRVVTAERGVVQSTVSGSGTIVPGNQVNVNFKVSGTLKDVYVSAGQHVYSGQLLADLDSQDQQVSVEQARASLASAEAQLQQAESGSSGSSSTSAGSSSGSSGSSGSGASAAQAGSSGSDSGSARGGSGSGSGQGGSGAGSARGGTRSGSGSSRHGAGTSASGNSNTANTAASAASRAASIASAQASVDSAQLSLQSAEQALAHTRLYAPVSGTVATIAQTQPGEAVGAGTTGTSSPSSSSSSSSSSRGAGAGGAGGANGGGSSSSSSGSGSTSSAFIVIVDLTGMDLTVPFSESDIPKLKVGQPATVTVNALPNTELAAHVTAIDTLSTTNSGVVSYNVTFHLDQMSSRLRPGMTASAQVVVSQAQGAVTVPSAAISGGSVTVIRGGRRLQQPVVTGVVGDSTTQVLSGLSPGDQVVITTSLNLGSSGGTPGGLGGGRLGGGGVGLFFGGGGGAVRFGGGGGGGGGGRGG